MKEKKLYGLIKRICTLCILLSFFLPTARGCSKVEIPNTIEEPWVSWTMENPEIHYVWDIFPFEALTGTTLLFLSLTYLWPIPFFFFGKRNNLLSTYLRMSFELLFGVIGTYFFILPIVFLGVVLIGGYLYLLAAGIYLGTTFVQLLQTITQHFLARKHTAKKRINR